MHQGQLVFAQLMRHLPLTTFRRCVVRYVEMSRATPSPTPNQGILRDLRECGEDTNLDRHLGLRPRRHRQEAAEPAALAL